MTPREAHEHLYRQIGVVQCSARAICRIEELLMHLEASGYRPDAICFALGYVVGGSGAADATPYLSGLLLGTNERKVEKSGGVGDE